MVTFLLHTWREKDLSLMVAVCLPFHSVDVHICKNIHLFTFVHRAKVFLLCHLLYQRHDCVTECVTCLSCTECWHCVPCSVF